MARRIEQIMSDLFKYSQQSYFNHKRENRPILLLIEKYFTKDELEEFLEKGSIASFEKKRIDEHNKLVLEEINKKLLEIEVLKNNLKQ